VNIFIPTYILQHESDIIKIEAVETERRSRLVHYRLEQYCVQFPRIIDWYKILQEDHI